MRPSVLTLASRARCTVVPTAQICVLSCGIDHLAAFLAHEHLFAVHLVFGEVFHVSLGEVAQATVEGDESRFDAFDLHALHHVLAEVQTCSGSGDRAFVFAKIHWKRSKSSGSEGRLMIS